MFDPELSRTAPATTAARPAGDRHMKVSPLDLRQLRFRRAFRGYDRAEVAALLAEVADDYEFALREVDNLRQEVAKMEALLNQHRDHERDLRNTLVTAQRLSDDIRANADAQAKQIVREAEGRSDLLLQKTQARLEDVQREIDGMRLKRRDVENSLESSISALRGTLEFVREQEQRERDEKILLHRPRQADQQPQSPMRMDEQKTAIKG
jgi:cell division initiation protein